ncbi:NAD-dependent deacetylase sirtuin-2 [Aspergillus heteromorphus CBS 117.55]|uniref:NAD-dependent protein deacetylase n=1 Tax=Aspergillus heteromorphus CBS 117.55 TaxID=1448321 RepID=A0A317X3L4_9EURO|nr:NAD-dependent deacetylase sirtuin-2 [Aspergillus heteromorphus CBS 117.55]PWY92935.1 NAD-dependent deacetylase sirtuin-2 [Aspergillus heteromorphus CBS 117.55]
MGNESSTVVDDSTPPSVLEARNLEGVAKYIKQRSVQRVVVMVGAGISTSAGIPDFRSPDTGLYSNLAYLDLPEPEDVFDIGFFRENPRPFYALARELAPGQFRPTIAHSFIKLLYDEGLLMKHFTQNIDCLERLAGVPGDMIVEAHGSFATQHCIDCKAEYPDDLMKAAVAKEEVPHCLQCQGLVKPDIVFFGEALPADFFENRELPEQADLCIIMGTSLTVQPFASLPGLVREGVPRVLINMERVGGLGSRPDDVLVLGDCDTGVRKLARALGWEQQLEAMWEATKPDQGTREAEQGPPPTREEQLQDEVDRLTEEVDRTLGFSSAYEERVRRHLEGTSSQKTDSAEETTRRTTTTTGAGQNDSESVGGLGHVFPHLARANKSG